jgi:hypothetical protein
VFPLGRWRWFLHGDFAGVFAIRAGASVESKAVELRFVVNLDPARQPAVVNGDVDVLDYVVILIKKMTFVAPVPTGVRSASRSLLNLPAPASGISTTLGSPIFTRAKGLSSLSGSYAAPTVRWMVAVGAAPSV